MMTNEQILTILATIKFVGLVIITDGHRVQFGPGEISWHACLFSASDEQRETLAKKLQLLEEIRTREKHRMPALSIVK
jgi:hypothetical protein